jgi:SAM-dependent methyltransferase
MSEIDPNTVTRVQAYQAEAGSTVTDGNEYGGLQIHAWRGLHDFLGPRIDAVCPKAGRALDLATGTGAMALRLKHKGFDVTAVDLVGDNFRLHDSIPFRALDLNRGFAAGFSERFDLVMAVELIEHLENPRHLLREIYALLNPGGSVIVTTPNLNSPVSKAMFARLGTLGWFTDEDYRDRGHITPVSRWQMEQCAQEIGFKLRMETFGNSYDAVAGWRSIQWLAQLVSRLSAEPRDHDGAVLISILTKPAR